jgi:hypothetical protein
MVRLTAAVVAAFAAAVLISAPATADEGCVPLVASVQTHPIAHAHVPGKRKAGGHRRHVHRVNLLHNGAAQRRGPAHPRKLIPAASRITRKPAPPLKHAQVWGTCPKAPLMSTRLATFAPRPAPVPPNDGPKPPVVAPPPAIVLTDLDPGDGLLDDPGGPVGGYVDGVILGGGVTNDFGGGRAGDPVGALSDPPPPSVPEPATWMMMLTGFFGLGAALRSARGCQGGLTAIELALQRKRVPLAAVGQIADVGPKPQPHARADRRQGDVFRPLIVHP